MFYISLAFDFWQVFLFGIQHLAFDFWHLLLAYSVKHFVSVSSVTLWHLYSTHAFHQRLGSFPGVGGGGTLGISRWGCAAGTLDLTYTRASSAEFCYPILE